MFRNLFSSSNSKDLSGQSQSLKDLIVNMTKALVDEPDKIRIDESNDSDEMVLFELRVSKSDLGKVIGKKGRTASAMRTILSAASRKHKIGADLKIVE